MFTPLKKIGRPVGRFYTEHSTIAFFLTLLIIFALIFVSHLLRTPEKEAEKPVRETKQTALYSESSPLYYQAASTVKKEGVTPIVALTSGVVSNIVVKPGQAVQNGTTLLILTNDYNSGSASLEKEIARNNFILTQEISRLDKDIQKNQESVTRSDDTLSNKEEKIDLKTLQKARETRKVTLTNAELNYRLTTVSDAVLKPRALSSGFVQNIKVKNGDFVSPGDVLATLSNPYGNTVLEATVPSETASFVDMTKSARITLSDGTVTEVVPTYFSASEDQDGMFMIQFILSDDVASKISLNENPKVELPLRFTHESTVLVPLDAVFKNSDSAVVLVAKDDKAEARTVQLGRVRGNYIEVLSGLEKNDQIILNRFVLAGDAIKVIQ